MPLTNEEFIKKAFDSGLNEQQVRAAVAERNQRLAQKTQPEKNPIQVVADFIAPTTSRLGSVIGTGAQMLSKDYKEAQKSQKRLDEMNVKIMQRAAKEKDLAKKAELQRAAQQGIATSTQIAQELATGQQQAARLTDEQMKQAPAEFLGRTALGTTAELASFLLPQGKATTGFGRVGQAALTGAGIGTLSGVSKAAQEAETLPEAGKTILERGITGATTGAVIQSGVEGVRLAQKGFSKAADFLKKKGYEAYATTFKENQTAQKIIDRSGGAEKLAKEFIDYGVPKTKGGVTKELSKLNSQYEKEVTSKLKTLGKTRQGNVDEMIDELVSEAKKIYSLPDPKTQRELTDFTNYLNSFRGQYTGPRGNLNNLNQLRKQLDKSYQGVDPSRVVDGEKLANDLLSDKLRRFIQDRAPVTKNFFKKYSLLKKAEQIFYKEPKTGIVEFTAAAASPGTGVVNVLEFLAGKAIRSPGITRGAATLATGRSPVNAPLPIPTGEIKKSAIKSSPVVPAGVLALQRMIDRERESKQQKNRLP